MVVVVVESRPAGDAPLRGRFVLAVLNREVSTKSSVFLARSVARRMLVKPDGYIRDHMLSDCVSDTPRWISPAGATKPNVLPSYAGMLGRIDHASP